MHKSQKRKTRRAYRNASNDHSPNRTKNRERLLICSLSSQSKCQSSRYKSSFVHYWPRCQPTTYWCTDIGGSILWRTREPTTILWLTYTGLAQRHISLCKAIGRVYRLVWATKVALAAICLVFPGLVFGYYFFIVESMTYQFLYRLKNLYDYRWQQ